MFREVTGSSPKQWSCVGKTALKRKWCVALSIDYNQVQENIPQIDGIKMCSQIILLLMKLVCIISTSDGNTESA